MSSNGPGEEWRSWHNTLRRLRAYLLGQQVEGEELGREEVPPETWIVESARDPERAQFAIETARRAADFANASANRVQDKATSLGGLVLALLPLVTAATGVAISRISIAPTLAWPATILMILADMLLACSALRAFLASGSITVGGLNLRRLAGAARISLSAVKAAEADAWLQSTEIAIETAHRRSFDLFAARRCVVLAFLLGAIAVPLLLGARSHAISPVTARPIPSISPSQADG